MRKPNFILAAGYVKDVADIERFARSMALDEITAGSYTLHKRHGNLEPTFIETELGSGSYFNAVGLRNGGLQYLERHMSKMMVAAGTKLLRISIAPIEQGDLKALLEFLRGCPGIIVEINTGCPNVWSYGIQKPLICHNIDAFRRTLDEVAKHRGDLITAVKISPPPEDPPGEEIRVQNIMECHFRGMDELVVINTLPNIPAIDKNGNRLLSVPLAGLSGRAIAELAIMEVRKTRKILNGIPGASMRLSGCGGIDSVLMVERMIEAGADAVQVGSYAFVNGPDVFDELAAGFEKDSPEDITSHKE